VSHSWRGAAFFKKNTMEINNWINKIIKGPTGFETWEDREGVIFHNSREEGIADFVIKCLSNPSCNGSSEVLEFILNQRNAKIPGSGELVKTA
jgi:hypothetical protein